MKIRRIIGDMPYDAFGKHATGREVYAQSAGGNYVWLPEFEGDDTENLPTTETDEEYRDRLFSEEEE